MSKELEALQSLRCMTSLSQDCPYIESNRLCDIIEKGLKALEIFEKCCIIAKYPDNTYELAFCKKIIIDKDEYNLLKEVLL